MWSNFIEKLKISNYDCIIIDQKCIKGMFMQSSTTTDSLIISWRTCSPLMDLDARSFCLEAKKVFQPVREKFE